MKMEWKIDDYENVIFGDYDNQKKEYVRLAETNELIPRLEDLLTAYNLENS